MYSSAFAILGWLYSFSLINFFTTLFSEEIILVASMCFLTSSEYSCGAGYFFFMILVAKLLLMLINDDLFQIDGNINAELLLLTNLRFDCQVFFNKACKSLSMVLLLLLEQLFLLISFFNRLNKLSEFLFYTSLLLFSCSFPTSSLITYSEMALFILFLVFWFQITIYFFSKIDNCGNSTDLSYLPYFL